MENHQDILVFFSFLFVLFVIFLSLSILVFELDDCFVFLSLSLLVYELGDCLLQGALPYINF